MSGKIFLKMNHEKVCILIQGKPGAGKSTLATNLNEKLNIKLIRYDVIIDLVCEYTRLYFENKKDEEPLVLVPDTFSSESDLKKFRINVELLIDKYQKDFRTLYKDFIKGTSTRKEWIEQGCPPEKRKQCIKLGPAAKHIQHLANEIFFLVTDHVIKYERFVMIEGFFFHWNSYLNGVLKLFEKVFYVKVQATHTLRLEEEAKRYGITLDITPSDATGFGNQVSYDQKKQNRIYEYGNKKFYSIDEIIETLIKDFRSFVSDKKYSQNKIARVNRYFNRQFFLFSNVMKNYFDAKRI